LIVFVLLFPQPKPADASVVIEGLSDWLAGSAQRSLEAVYEHIPPNEPRSVKEELLKVVADRILLGYTVARVALEGDVVRIELDAASAPSDWLVAITPPNLSHPVDAWFASDTDGMSGEIADLIQGLPMETLTWGDLDLRREIERLSAERIPGWRVALMARSSPDGKVVLDVSFTPEQPLALAVNTKINSSSIPAMLHSNLRDDLVKGFAPVIGVPVLWLDRHKADMELRGRDILADEYLVETARADPVVEATTGVVSQVDVELESRRYSASVWLAVYAGAEERYPEAGVHLGRRAQIFPHWDMELYGELMIKLDDWGLENRLGMRWSPWRNVWVGGEWSSDGDIWWARVSLESWAKRPYAWLRMSEEEDINAAIGYHFSDYLSIELNYDSRFDDYWNVRALMNL
jgi:hypothetical protein